MIEIERKFLVNEKLLDLTKANYKVFIQQGYFIKADEGSVRVRSEIVAHTNAEVDDVSNQVTSYIMIKRKIDDKTNDEILFPISFGECVEYLNGCKKVIEKTRYVFIIGKCKWEIDVFGGFKTGLIMAELELQDMSTSEIQEIQMPPWIAEEVTGKHEYYNVNMV